MDTRKPAYSCLVGLRSEVCQFPEERDLSNLHNEQVGECDRQCDIAGRYQI